MSEGNKSVLDAVYDAIKNAVGDDTFELPLLAWQPSGAESDEINELYCEEIKQYVEEPVPPCSFAASLKLLKRFSNKSFNDFWREPVTEYLPAVSEGTMKLCEYVYPHDEAVSYAKELIASLSVKELAKDFLYGVANNAPEYRTALACYFYVKNLPEHQFQKKYVGSTHDGNGDWVERYNDDKCEICGYQHTNCREPKMQFWHVNVDMSSFYFYGLLGRSNLNTVIMFLEEYKILPRPQTSKSDYDLFMKVIDVIENTPENMTSGKLRKVLKQSGLLKMTNDQIQHFVDMLGFLDILHPEDSHGMVYTHTMEKDMLDPLSFMGYAQHPVNRWTGKCGVDYESLKLLFDGIYNN